MRKMMLVFLTFATITTTSVSAAQYHWDSRPGGINDSQWWDIIGDHYDDDGHCDNTDGDQQGFPDIDCGAWNDYPNAPIQDINQDCGTGSCTVSTTARCLYLHPAPNPYPAGHYVTFTCTGSATGPNGGVASGYLGNGKKGVRCGPVECGCQLVCPPGGLQWSPTVWVACYNQFFGFPQQVGGNTANYVCQ